ncbi:MAG: GntR family transcriptional regulator [Clostridia bacterium]
MTGKDTRYHQIAEYYRRLIETKELPEGTKMPTEEQLCTMFQVSRITARQAMSELAQSGFIERVQGKGSFVKVKKMDMQLNHLQGFTEEMRAKGMVASSRVLASAVVPCDLQVAEHLKLEEAVPVFSVERLRLADDEPVAVEHVYIPFYLCPELEQSELGGSLYQMLSKSGLKVARATQDIAAGFSPRAICELLKIKQTMPTLNIERVTFLENGTPLEYVLSAYRSDRYTFHVEMAR